MRKIFALTLAVLLVLSMFSGCSVHDDRVTINVYNWGQYISEGDDDCIDVIAEFEKAYPNIRVNYVTFDSNETMYTKMANEKFQLFAVSDSIHGSERPSRKGLPHQVLINEFIPDCVPYD